MEKFEIGKKYMFSESEAKKQNRTDFYTCGFMTYERNKDQVLSHSAYIRPNDTNVLWIEEESFTENGADWNGNIVSSIQFQKVKLCAPLNDYSISEIVINYHCSINLVLKEMTLEDQIILKERCFEHNLTGTIEELWP